MKKQELQDLRAKNRALQEEVAEVAALVIIGGGKTSPSGPPLLMAKEPVMESVSTSRSTSRSRILGSVSPVPDLISPERGDDSEKASQSSLKNIPEEVSDAMQGLSLKAALRLPPGYYPECPVDTLSIVDRVAVSAPENQLVEA